MSGIYLLKGLLYAALIIFLFVERCGIVFYNMDFEFVMSGVLILVAFIECGVNFLMWATTISDDKEKFRANK